MKWAAALWLTFGLFGVVLAQAVTRPYEVSVWARVLFGPDGRAQAITMVDEPGLTPPFLQAARLRLERARIEPRTLAGQAVSFRTGVRMVFEVAPGPEGGSVRLMALEMLPLPLKRAYAAYPQDIAQSEGWTGVLVGSCKVALDGRCGAVGVRSVLVTPETARRFVRESLELWRFEPQEVAGQPVESEFSAEFLLKAELGAPEDFRQDKFERITKGR